MSESTVSRVCAPTEVEEILRELVVDVRKYHNRSGFSFVECLDYEEVSPGVFVPLAYRVEVVIPITQNNVNEARK